MEFDPTEDISFPPGTETITVAFHGQNPITKHPILISYHLKVPTDYVRLQFLKIRDSRGGHPRQRNTQCTSLANSSSPLARLNNITLGSLFCDLRHNISYQQVEHIRIEPASTSSTNTAVTAPAAAPELSATTSPNLANTIRSAPMRVSNAGTRIGDELPISTQVPQLAKAKQSRTKLAKAKLENGNCNSMVSVVIPSTPSAPEPTYPRTRSQSRKPQSDASPCFPNHASPSGTSSSSSRESVLDSSPPSSPPRTHFDKDSSICDACPVCRLPGELFRIKGREFVWCNKHSNQSPVLRSSIGKDADVVRSRDNRHKRTPKNSASKFKALALTTTTTQISSGKSMKEHDGGRTSKKRDCSAVGSKRKRRHVTPDEVSSSEST